MEYVLVTGGAGFIGSHLAKALAEDFKVVIVDNLSTGRMENIAGLSNIHFYEWDIRNEKKMEAIFRKYQFIKVFHLAAIANVMDSINHPYETHLVNQEATLKLLECVRKTQKQLERFVFSSSAAVYGDDETLPKKEDSTIKPISGYAIDKYASEQFCLAYQKTYNIPTTVVRFFNVYGPNQNPNSPYSGVVSLLNKVAKNILNGKKEYFTIFGDGRQTRDFIYVKDIVANLISLSNEPNSKGEIVNIATGNHITLGNLVELYEKSLGIKIPVIYKEQRAGDIKNSYADITKLKKLGIVPKYSIELGISNILSYEKTYKREELIK